MFIFLSFILPFLLMDAVKASYWGVITVSIYSWLFMLVTQIGHLADDLVCDAPGTVNNLWYRHQVETSVSFSKDS